MISINSINGEIMKKITFTALYVLLFTVFIVHSNELISNNNKEEKGNTDFNMSVDDTSSFLNYRVITRINENKQNDYKLKELYQEFINDSLKESDFLKAYSLNLDLENYKSYLKYKDLKRYNDQLTTGAITSGMFTIVFPLFYGLIDLFNDFGNDMDIRPGLAIGSAGFVVAIPFVLGAVRTMKEKDQIKIFKKDGAEFNMMINYGSKSYGMSLNKSF